MKTLGVMLLMVAALFAGCENGNDGAASCVPGAVQTCPCSNGGAGTQTCDEDGTWMPCIREDGMCMGGGGVDAAMADAAAVDGEMTLTDGGASSDAVGSTDAAIDAAIDNRNHVSINSVDHDYTSVSCSSLSTSRYHVQGCIGNSPCYVTWAVFVSTGGPMTPVPPPAGTYTIVVSPSQMGEMSLSVGSPDSGYAVVAQSGTVSVVYVNNRPDLTFANIPATDMGTGLSSPLSGHMRCP